MLNAYSIAAEVAADAAIPFNNVTVEKGCTAVLSSPATVNLNRCGVYKVEFYGTADAAMAAQLYRDNVAVQQAKSTGENLAFGALIQVDRNNTACCCSSPVSLQVRSDTATTLDCSIVVTKIC